MPGYFYAIEIGLRNAIVKEVVGADTCCIPKNRSCYGYIDLHGHTLSRHWVCWRAVGIVMDLQQEIFYEN